MTTERRELVARIWSRDPTVWTGKDEARWLGWLDEPERMRDAVDPFLRLGEDVLGDAETVVLLGMGGSSLAPEVIRTLFDAAYVHVLDTTHPGAIRRLSESIDRKRTLFLSASKSGSTLETRSHTEYFWKLVPRPERWVAITDPGSSLATLATERSFAAVIPGERTIGGRYSALSPFGLFPAALAGVDLAALLDRAVEMAEACRLDDGNPGLELGLALGLGWQDGRDKVCLPDAGAFGLWVEQLIAESTGKGGKGLVPAQSVPGGGRDRQVHEVRLASPLELGQEFFRWEFATAVAGSILGINPFDQPDVQAAKDKTTEVLRGGGRPLEPDGSVDELLDDASPPNYICVQAFIDPTDANAERIGVFARSLGERTGCVVTHGFGPRYLHSTGQLHKGGANTGLFVQVVEEYGPELAIPGQPFGFAQLIRAQAAGDFESLRARGRRIARITLEEVP